MELAITAEHLQNLIESVRYEHTGKTTICIMKLHCGFEVIGTAGVLDRTKYDPAIGEKFSREDAINKLWQLEGYHLQRHVELLNKGL